LILIDSLTDFSHFSSGAFFECDSSNDEDITLYEFNPIEVDLRTFTYGEELNIATGKCTDIRPNAGGNPLAMMTMNYIMRTYFTPKNS